MLTRDIHSSMETVNTALYDLDISIKLGKKEKDKLVCLIVGYGSKGNSHKIKTACLAKLDELVRNNTIKDYIVGSNLDIFSSVYQNFKYKDRIPESEKTKKNPGAIYIIV